jgi:hypothetical protein
MSKKHQTSEERLESILEKGIRIGDYVIYTDAYNFMVVKIATVTGERGIVSEENTGRIGLAKEENIGKEYADTITYHATLQQAVSHVLTDQQLQNIENLTFVLKKHHAVLDNLSRLKNLKIQLVSH